MRKFMNPGRLWGREGGPAEDWVRPHVLWLPQGDPQVLDYFGRVREIVSRYPDVITPITDDDLHMTIQSVNQLNATGARVDEEQMATAAAALRSELAGMEPFDIEIGPARASGSAGIVEIWPETGPAELYRRVRTGLTDAGMSLPPEQRDFWCHMSCGYGFQDTDTPELAARSDKLAPNSAEASGRGSAPRPPSPRYGSSGSARIPRATPTPSGAYTKSPWGDSRSPHAVGTPAPG
ncbi:hypothetical protein [Streptomyces sp. MP131-18]|uniref:2'-5' RNA ligase family protein n=1 Tax=Streptomyces sp. MP131-18 TaxID=1857892 RepID=UPI0009CF7C16|nr:hypothetical protein [Streptomyces sp. MP131-18]ONK13191.1 hypothetical protein STBA_39540 [Streptomyces sp. MP131-18]